METGPEMREELSRRLSLDKWPGLVSRIQNSLRAFQIQALKNSFVYHTLNPNP